MGPRFALAIVAALASCGDPAAAPVPPDADPARAVTFRLSYQPTASDAPAAIYLTRGCIIEWIDVLAPDLLRPHVEPSCSRCSCSTCEIACDICDCGFHVWQLEPGASRDFTWSGTLYVQSSTPNCNRCEAEATLAYGPQVARFCYSVEEDGANPLCVDQPFDYPTSDIVEHVVTALP